MFSRFANLRRFFVDLPQQVRLAYCLVRSPEVPIYTKVAFVGGLGLLLSPVIDIPEDIPLVGEIDTLAVTLLALKLFIAACPDEVVIEQEQRIIEQTSVFDDDVRKGQKIALMIAARLRGEDEQSVVGTNQRSVADWATNTANESTES